MRFIYPEFLPAVLFIIVPILIHFIHFKRFKTVYFSQVNFLKAIKQESKKKNNLKQLLILLSRILAIIALVLVFCQPYLPANKRERKASRKLVAVYLDNSFSMKSESGVGTLLEAAKNKALAIANSYGPGASFLLMDNQNSPDRQLLLNKGQFVSRLESIKEIPTPVNVSKVYQLLLNSLSKQPLKTEKIIYLLSDFQEYTTDLHTIKPDSSAHVFLIPLGSPVENNLLIDSCWFENPGHQKEKEETLRLRIQNLSEQDYQNIPVRLKINDTIKAINNLSVEAKSKTELEFIYKNNRAGTHRGVAELDDYPIVYDNQFFFSYEVREKNEILIISAASDPASSYLEALFKNDDNIAFTKMEPEKIQVSQFPNYQCIFLLNLTNPGTGLSDALTSFVENGGTLGIFPGSGANILAFNHLYQSLQAGSIQRADSSDLQMSKVNFNHQLLQNVFQVEKENLQLPSATYSYRFSKTETGSQTNIIDFNNGQPAISEFHFGNGRLYNFNFPLQKNYTDFNRHAIFVPLVYNIALNSYEIQQIQHEVQDNVVLSLPKKKELTNIREITLASEKSGEAVRITLLNEFAGQLRVDLQNTVAEAGFYEILINGEPYKTLAFNYNRNESLSRKLAPTQLKEKLEAANLSSFEVIESGQTAFEQAVREANDGIELWQLFVALALLFIAAEIAIIRFWK